MEFKSLKDFAFVLFTRADKVKPASFSGLKAMETKNLISQSNKTTDGHAAYTFSDYVFHKALVKTAYGQS
jgi:hypothetical protein